MTVGNSSDHEIVEQILDGKTDRYEVLIDRHSAIIFHVVRRYIKEDVMAEELAQQIFVKAFGKLDTFDHRSKFSTWLYSLAKNHCLDYLKNIRRKNKNFSELKESILQETLRSELTPDQEVEEKEWEKILYEALNNITQDFAQAFLLKYRDEMTYKAMSDRLGVSISALKVRVHRARKELKEYIKDNT